jgi:hypothetical protein
VQRAFHWDRPIRLTGNQLAQLANPDAKALHALFTDTLGGETIVLTLQLEADLTRACGRDPVIAAPTSQARGTRRVHEKQQRSNSHILKR